MVARSGGPAVRLDADLARVPAGITTIVVGGSLRSGTLDAVRGLEVLVAGWHGRILARYPVAEVERVTAPAFGELYQHQV
ncbi:hypothetical protein [Dactylosporangium sp. NPDC005555]|uniref:hypothetical protein n=1 Tax=Dactylosporangium sp. NPDC005555 TaxID=3154889 RepID=UPI0033BB7D16